MSESYLQWLVKHTRTRWWHDSGNPQELTVALEHGASGVTTNPVLTTQTLHNDRAYWAAQAQAVLSQKLPAAQQAEALTRVVAVPAATQYHPVFDRTNGKEGYVCAQVNPALAGDRDAMFAMAQRFHAMAPNIAVKLPVTAAGLDVLEQCTGRGITVTATVSFCAPQVVQVAEAYRRGIRQAQAQGITPGQCFAVIMIGRLDDYLREVAKDAKTEIQESDIRQAGLAVTKQAYRVFQERGYEAVLLIAALRGTYHMTELAGADLIMSIHPKYQTMLLAPDIPREERINKPIADDVLARLQTLPEFRRSYEPDGMAPSEFITYGVTQRTLSQFTEVGWKPLETYRSV